ncbi:hypothetical protein PAPYR_4668 [Paratrimastix pyriformis]|uniref:Uncharacterized protein n=1 Tax=Paratrimastix pyriformis TaxID=342808 RepID=A0ABQ8ULN8_9EUKA|nr:hypothetical protein PAPYR_4668 [Paratrimastix pyriformis]
MWTFDLRWAVSVFGCMWEGEMAWRGLDGVEEKGDNELAAGRVLFLSSCPQPLRTLYACHDIFVGNLYPPIVDLDCSSFAHLHLCIPFRSDIKAGARSQLHRFLSPLANFYDLLWISSGPFLVAGPLDFTLVDDPTRRISLYPLGNPTRLTSKSLQVNPFRFFFLTCAFVVPVSRTSRLSVFLSRTSHPTHRHLSSSRLQFLSGVRLSAVRDQRKMRGERIGFGFSSQSALCEIGGG